MSGWPVLSTFCLFVSPLPLAKLVNIFIREWRCNSFSQIPRFGFSSNIFSGVIRLKEILKLKLRGNKSNVSEHNSEGELSSTS